MAKVIKTEVTSTTKKKRKTGRGGKKKYTSCTYTGHQLTTLEAKFIDFYVETGNQRQSVIEAGYKTKAPGQYAQDLLKKTYIVEEINYRMKQLEDAKTASAQEILEYFTRVMRGEEKDQFGLEAPLSERTRAAQELAKRKIDIANKINGKAQAEVKISLNWEGMDDESESE